MSEDHDSILDEIRDMLKILADGQQELIKEIRQLKEGQKKLHDEIRINNFILNNISLGNEIIN